MSLVHSPEKYQGALGLMAAWGADPSGPISRSHCSQRHHQVLCLSELAAEYPELGQTRGSLEALTFQVYGIHPSDPIINRGRHGGEGRSISVLLLGNGHILGIWGDPPVSGRSLQKSQVPHTRVRGCVRVQVCTQNRHPAESTGPS